MPSPPACPIPQQAEDRGSGGTACEDRSQEHRNLSPRHALRWRLEYGAERIAQGDLGDIGEKREGHDAEDREPQPAERRAIQARRYGRRRRAGR